MTIFPKCMIGREPFVTCHGYLLPCCWLDIPRYTTNSLLYDENGNLIKNIFLNENFNLNKRSYKAIIESDEWWLTLEKLKFIKYNNCIHHCDSYFLLNDEIIHRVNEIEKLTTTQKEIKLKNNNLFLNKLVNPENINEIQLELTNRCSLKCLYCARLKDKPNNSDLKLSIIEDILSYKSWNTILDVGSYGDTSFYSYYKQFLTLITNNSVNNYKVSLAATGKGIQWWDEITELYKKIVNSGTNVTVTFGIDGLENTSKIHRVGQDWNEITYGLRKSVDAGCKVFWQFIPMSFNEHQIEEAKQLAKTWGCNFYIKHSNRFQTNDKNIPTKSNLYISKHDN